MAADLYANGAARAMMGEADQRYIVASATPSDRKEHHWGILVMTFPYLAGMDHKVPHGVPERMVHRVANGKEFDSAQAGGLVRNLPIEGVRITDRGAGVVERHISRFQSEDANNFMIERLRRIAQISLKLTERDLNYHYARIEGICQIQAFGGRESGVPKDSMEAHRLWSNMHAVTPKDYRLNSNIPYHPGAIHVKFW